MGTPMIECGLTDETKIIIIERHFRCIMDALGLDLEDDSLKDTPARVAKMYVKEIFSGLKPENFPKITTIENKFKYDQMLIECDIELNSNCEHHFVPIVGKAHVAYIPRKKVIGLSKINRIVKYFSKRPQVQERLTEQIKQSLQTILETTDVAVVIEAEHMCVKTRGIEDATSWTRTQSLGGAFHHAPETRSEFFNSLPRRT